MKSSGLARLTTAGLSILTSCAFAGTPPQLTSADQTATLRSTSTTQLASRAEIEAEVQKLWDKRSFDELDRLEKSLRSANATSTSGWPLLFMFYQALDELPTRDGGNNSDLDAAMIKTDQWLAKTPSSQFGKFLKVDFLTARAWRARGSGYANTVSTSQWKEFNAYMKQATDYLVRHKDELSPNPNWYIAMLEIGNASSWSRSEYDALLKEAVKKHGNYLPLLTKAVYHFTPKWGGSYQEMDQFISSSSSNVAPADRDELYARQYSYAFENALFSNLTQSQVDCARWLRGHEVIVRKYATRFNVNHAAFAAVVCANRPIAALYLKQLGAQSPDFSIWGRREKGVEAFGDARLWATGER